MVFDAVAAPPQSETALMGTSECVSNGDERTLPLSSNTRSPKKQLLVACRIEGHKIQKHLSPRKKALDPLRYLPDSGSYYALFTVAAYFEAETEDGEDAADGDKQRRHAVQRSYKQFCTLHARTYPKSHVPHDLPSMRNKRYDNEYIEEKRNELTTYLSQLMLIPEVKASAVLKHFLEAPASASDSSDDEDGLLVPSRMLEGLPGTIVTVRAGQSFSVTLPLSAAGDVASWQFTTKKHNIGFSATFEGEMIRAYSREGADVKPIKGFYRCTAPGTCTLTWDNTYTWGKAKVLIYWAEVESQTMPSQQNGLRQLSSASAFSQDDLSLADGSDAGAVDADNRRMGFIEHTRTNSMNPRHLMNSSISLITKPFVHGNGGDDDGSTPRKTRKLIPRRTSAPAVAVPREVQAPRRGVLQGKAGSLIIQRSVKFRGRNWYRKWFVLDPRKCILRYYDSETAARRGLSIAKLNLTNKHASLAITSSLSLDAAPTPYMFLVRTKKRCWKICASSQSEYNEWENAISTAILTAQLSRRGRSSKKAMVKAARTAAVRKDSHSSESDDETTQPNASIDAGDIAKTSVNPSLKPDKLLSPIEESDDDDDDDDFESKGDGESDSDSDDESESDSDEELHENDAEEGIVHTIPPQQDVRTTDNAQLELQALPTEWKLGFVAVLNVALLSVRSAPATIIILVLFVMDWYLILKYLKDTTNVSSGNDLDPSTSTKPKTE
ncbi:hypothetical protein BBJ29_005653 [Phytophthora kernoviae]|uniref:PX domain-containing protein n=1 Tax=Phytophthora kernoviae TaxID=325452 RepID=A0A3F2RUX3_9STRA|nr:hypothetical protein BBP00_00003936 [Phytophthora kernoviae]RLN64677.1 hypothetical protein BBJ29_005653 [Phytophthora kernoviae]